MIHDYKFLKASRFPRGLGLAWIITSVLFVCSLFLESYESDLGYWRDWLQMLNTGGYAALDANYPPLLLHWIHLASPIFDFFGLQIVPLFLIKIWVELPVLFCWMLLLWQVASALEARKIDPISSSIFWLAALNPAIALDNPIWGQVDLLPWLPLSLGIIAFRDDRKAWQAPVWFAIALLVKFQTIIFSPVFAALFIRSVRKRPATLWGIPVAGAVVLLAFLPFSLAGKGWEQASKAYWGNIDTFPEASLNAANLWKLNFPDGAHHDQSLPGFEDMSWMTPKKVGMVLFALVSLFTLTLTLRRGSNPWLMSLLSAFGFFAFCSAMHERYLFLAVPVAAMWAAEESRGKPWFAFTTFVVFSNIAFILFPDDRVSWQLLSILIVLAVPLLFLQALNWKVPVRAWEKLDLYPRRTALLAMALPVAVFTQQLLSAGLRGRLDLEVGESRAFSDWTPTLIEQQWEQPKFAPEKGEPMFSFFQNSKRLTSGLRTHALSRLVYSLPKGKYQIQGWAGPGQDVSPQTLMHFEIRSGDNLVWKSAPVDQQSKPVAINTTIQGPTALELRVEPDGDNISDHALWGDLTLVRVK